MSMLSAQCDELRELADDIESRYGYPTAVKALRDAADTILSLRDRAQDLQTHNAKLRKERDMYRDLVDCMVHPDIPDQLAAENAKLRGAVKRMHEHIRQTCGECDGWYCSNFDEDNECCVYDTLARELGVEVGL